MKTSFDPDSCLRSLKAEFTAFRAQSRSHARVPDHLRRAVLAALASGLKPSRVTSVLGVTPTQLKIWRHPLPQVAVEKCPRILDVIAPTPVATAPTGLRMSYEAGRLLLEISF